MIAYAKANPGKVHVGSSGTNSNLHIALELLKAATATDITHVPYRGTGPALNDVVAGTIEAAYTTTVSAAGLIESGQVKVLGVAGAKRMDADSEGRDVRRTRHQGCQRCALDRAGRTCENAAADRRQDQP